jgi:hypothetical protein
MATWQSLCRLVHVAPRSGGFDNNNVNVYMQQPNSFAERDLSSSASTASSRDVTEVAVPEGAAQCCLAAQGGLGYGWGGGVQRGRVVADGGGEVVLAVLQEYHFPSACVSGEPARRTLALAASSVTLAPSDGTGDEGNVAVRFARRSFAALRLARRFSTAFCAIDP